MPLLFRSMLPDGEKPRIGHCGKTLGVRVAPTPHHDIEPDCSGLVHPCAGGMSVAPAWRVLPFFLIPARLKDKVRRARGNDELVIWRMGDGPFEAGPVADSLAFRPDPKNPGMHGFVEPMSPVPVADYQAALMATQGQWIRDEE